MDPNTPLHPNLARIAAEYDEICELYASGRLDAGEARRSIAALAARDDNGTIWSIDPATGDWVYRNVHGALVPGTPPTWGYATPTAYDVTRSAPRHDPRHRVVAFAVDDSITSPPGSLLGSTRAPERSSRRTRRGWTWVVLALAVVAGLWWTTSRAGEEAPANPAVPTAPAIPADG